MVERDDRRVQRDAGGEDRRHHVPPAGLLGPDRPDPPVARRGHRRGQPAPLLLPRPARAARDQDPARRRHPPRVGARGVHLPPRARDVRHRRRAHRHQRHPGDAVRRRPARRRPAPRPGRAQRAAAGRGQGRHRRPARAARRRRRWRPGRRVAPSDVAEPVSERSPLDAVHRAARGADGALRRLGDAPRVPDRHARRAHGVPAAGRRVRRLAPRHRAGRRRRRPRHAAGRAVQRPRQDRLPAGPSTPTCSTTPTARCSTTSSCGGTRVRRRRRLRRDAERLEHRPGPGRHRRSRDDARAGRARRAGTGRRSSCLGGGVPRGGGRRPLPRRPRDLVRACRASSPAPATRASGASRSRCRPSPPPTCGPRSPPPASPPAGLGARDTLRLEAGLPLHGHELGPGDHAAAGRPRLGRGVGQADVPRQGGAGGRAGCRCGPTPRRHRHRGPPPAARRVRRARRRRPQSARSRAATSRRCSATASPSAFVPPAVEEGAAVAIDVRGTALPGTVVPTPFVKR